MPVSHWLECRVSVHNKFFCIRAGGGCGLGGDFVWYESSIKGHWCDRTLTLSVTSLK